MTDKEKGKVLLFGGTSEGRELAERLARAGIETEVCVATEYGEQLLDAAAPCLSILKGRLDEAQMKELLRGGHYRAVVDATHPYAVVVSQNIRAACAETGHEYLRLLRASSDFARDGAVIEVASVEAAAEYLRGTSGSILLTTGSKELHKYTVIEDYQNRCYARVLPSVESMEICDRLGFEGSHRLAMQGPFSEDLNVAMLKSIGAAFMVTKESGKPGGFAEKLRAARRANAKMILVRRPQEESGYTLEEVGRRLGLPEYETEFPLAPTSQRKKAYLIGIGMGSRESLTGEALEALAEAEIVFGAGRILESLEFCGRPMERLYLPGAVRSYLDEHPQYQTVAVAFSGDLGFYSGAKKMIDALEGWELSLIPGISSPVYFCSRLQMPWEDVRLISMHGRRANLVAAVRSNPKVFCLVGGDYHVGVLCRELVEYQLTRVRLHVGVELSYPGEKILHGSPEELMELSWSGLQVVLIENPEAKDQPVTESLPDTAFLRGRAPMTKEEVRVLSVAKLRLTRQALVYDIGAGTGSVSVEIARTIPEGQVYAIEKESEALELLETNKKQLGAANLTVVAGTAPEAMKGLPAPTHVFIGGSSGHLEEILALLREASPRVRVVINAVTLETLTEVTRLCSAYPDFELVQLQAARARALGRYHLMTGQNPVWIVSFTLTALQEEENDGADTEQ